MDSRYVSLELLAGLQNLSLAARYVCEGMIGGAHKSAYVGYNAEFSHHREYLPGDEIRHIDWKRYAKSEKLYIRQYEESASLNAMILLDDSASMQMPSEKGLTKAAYARIIAASLSWLLLRQRDGVGIMTFSDAMLDLIPISARMTQFAQIVKVLDTPRPSHGQTRLSEALDTLLPLLKKKCMILLISDFVERQAPLQEAIQKIAYHNHEMIAFQILTPEELDFPWSDFSIFQDSETQDTLLMEGKGVKEEYLQNLKLFLAETEEFLRRHHSDYLMIRSSHPVEKALSHFLYRRSRHV